jgi:RNA polymerase sigma factor (sigma-70 family)
MRRLNIVEGGPDFRAVKPESEALRDLFAALDTKDVRRRDEAWARVQKGLEPTVRATIRSRVRGAEHLVDEIAQETFLGAFTRLDTFDRKGNFTAWIKMIANNRAVDFLRQRYGRHGGRPREESFEDLMESGGERGVLVEQDTPEARALRAGREDEIREAIVGLTSHQREVVLLHDVLGLTNAQVGLILNHVTESRISQLRTQALNAMRATRGRPHPSAMSKDAYQALLRSLRERAKSALGHEFEEAA